MISFLKETFTKTDTEPIPIMQQTPELCQVSTKTENSNIDPRSSSSGSTYAGPQPRGFRGKGGFLE